MREKVKNPTEKLKLLDIKDFVTVTEVKEFEDSNLYPLLLRYPATRAFLVQVKKGLSHPLSGKTLLAFLALHLMGSEDGSEPASWSVSDAKILASDFKLYDFEDENLLEEVSSLLTESKRDDYQNFYRGLRYDFPAKQSEKKLTFKLFHFTHLVGHQEVIKEMEKEMKKEGFRPATLQELLSFREEKPDLQRQFSIIALGLGWLFPHSDKYLPMLEQGDPEKNKIYSDIHGIEKGMMLWRYLYHHPNTRFLAVQK